MLFASSVNQDIGSSSTVTMTVTMINKSVGGEHGPLACTAAVQGPASAPPATFHLPSLALCCNSNAEGVALEESRSPQGRGVQLVTEAATQHFWVRNTLHRGAAMENGDEAGRMEVAPVLWQLSHGLHNKDPSPRF